MSDKNKSVPQSVDLLLIVPDAGRSGVKALGTSRCLARGSASRTPMPRGIRSVLGAAVLGPQSCCIKAPQIGQLQKQKFILSSFWRLQVQDQGVGWFGSFRGLSPWLEDGHLLPVSTHGLPSVCLCPKLLFQGYQSDWIRPHPYDLIYLNYLFKGPVAKYSHILRSQG